MNHNCKCPNCQHEISLEGLSTLIANVAVGDIRSLFKTDPEAFKELRDNTDMFMQLLPKV